MSLTFGFCLGDEDTEYNSKQFSEAIRAAVGEGVCEYGSRFALSLTGGFRLTLGTGYALVNGRWLENDEPYPLTLPPSGNNSDRYDAIAATANYTNKAVTLKTLVGVDPDALRRDMSMLRNETEYSIILYMVHVRRGSVALSLRDVEDVRADSAFCGEIMQARRIAGDVLKVYDFLRSGIDREVSRIVGLAEAEIDKANAGITALDTAIRQKTGNDIGDVITSLRSPLPSREWLLCDGGDVPEEFPELSEMLDGVLPDIQHEDPRFRSYIFAGEAHDGPGPDEPGEDDSAIVGVAVVGIAIVGKDVS